MRTCPRCQDMMGCGHLRSHCRSRMTKNREGETEPARSSKGGAAAAATDRREMQRQQQQQQQRSTGRKRRREEEKEEAAAAAAASSVSSDSGSVSSRRQSAPPPSRPSRLGPSRRTRSQMRRTRSSGRPMEAREAETETRKRRAEGGARGAAGGGRQRRRSSAPSSPPHLRRMRRAPLSLVLSPPSSLRTLLPSLCCPVCGQLLVSAVCLPCGHSACDFCLYSHLQLKAACCPVCSAPVDDEDRSDGQYALSVAALDSAVDAVAARVLDAKGAAARRRRQRLDAADMKRVRAVWKRRHGAEARRERREKERQQLRDEMRLFHRRMRPHAFTDSGAAGAEAERRQQAGGSEDEDDDDDFVPESELESDDSVGAAQQHVDEEEAEGDSASGSSSDDGSSSSSGRGSGGESAASSSSPSICSSEEDSVELDRGLILPSPRRRRPQRTAYCAMLATQRSLRARRVLCKHCQQTIASGELLIRIQHGETTQWSHPLCLSSSITGRTLPLARIEGLARLTRQQQQAVSEAWATRDELQQEADTASV